MYRAEYRHISEVKLLLSSLVGSRHYSCPLSLDCKYVAYLILGAEPPCLPACIPHKCPILINLFLDYQTSRQTNKQRHVTLLALMCSNLHKEEAHFNPSVQSFIWLHYIDMIDWLYTWMISALSLQDGLVSKAPTLNHTIGFLVWTAPTLNHLVGPKSLQGKILLSAITFQKPRDYLLVARVKTRPLFW